VEYVADQGQRFADKSVESPASALFASDKSGIDKLLHVVGDGGLGESDWADKIADAGFLSVVGGNEGK